MPGHILYILYINNLGSLISNSSIHYYADDIVIYSLAPSIDKALSNMKADFFGSSKGPD